MITYVHVHMARIVLKFIFIFLILSSSEYVCSNVNFDNLSWTGEGCHVKVGGQTVSISTCNQVCLVGFQSTLY